MLFNCIVCAYMCVYAFDSGDKQWESMPTLHENFT